MSRYFLTVSLIRYFVHPFEKGGVEKNRIIFNNTSMAL